MEGCSRSLCSAACSLDVQSVGEKSASGHLRKRNARKLERRARLGDFERAVLGHHVSRRHRPSHADLQVPLLVETLRIRVDSQVQVRVDRQELISHLARRRGRVDHHELLGVLGRDACLERVVQRHLSEFRVGRRLGDVDIDKAAQGVAPPRTHGRRQSPGRGEPCPALRDASQRACAGRSRVKKVSVTPTQTRKRKTGSTCPNHSHSELPQRSKDEGGKSEGDGDRELRDRGSQRRAGLQPVHALRACPDRAQSRTGGLQTQDDLRPGCLRGPVTVGEPRRGVPPYTNMATEDETPRGALACLHIGGAGTSCGRGAKGLSARGSG